MSAGVFEPLLRHLAAELSKKSPGGVNRTAADNWEAELADWAADKGVIGGAAGRVGATGAVWLVVLLATTLGLLLMLPRRPRRHRPTLFWVLGVATAAAALATLTAAGIFSCISHRQLTALESDEPQVALADVVTTAEEVLTRSVRLANATLAELCADAEPRLRRLLDGFAARLATGLSADARLTPLLDGLDTFVATVETVVAAMTAIAAARGGVSEELIALKAIADDIRTRTAPVVVSVCGEIGTCGDLEAHLAELRVLPSASRLDADASVTAVTLLDRVFRLNVTELGQRVLQAKSTITTTLGSAGGQVGQLVARLAAGASDGLQRGMDGIANATAAGRAAIARPQADAAVRGAWTGAVAAVTALWVSVLALGGLLTSLVPLRCGKVGRGRSPSRRPRQVVVATATCCAAAVLSALFVAGAAAAGVGRTAAAEGCAPLTTADGRRALDARLDAFLREAAWPELERLLAGLPVPLPIRLGPGPPTGVLRSLLFGCGPNRTLAHALGLNLSSLLDSGRLLDSNLVSRTLDGVKDGLKKKLLRGAAASLVPTQEVGNVLASLAQFAAVLDPVDYSASILELAQPLFQLDTVSLRFLPARLSQLGSRLLTRNATDTRGFRLANAADRLRLLVSEQLPPLAAGLAGLRRRFETLQLHRNLGSLTTGLAVRLADFSAGLAGLTADGIDRRFNESFGATRPEAIELLDDLLGRALAGVGRCDGLPELAGRVGDLCELGADNLCRWGAWLQVAAATVCACWLLGLAWMRLKFASPQKPQPLTPSIDNKLVNSCLIGESVGFLVLEERHLTEVPSSTAEDELAEDADSGMHSGS